MIFKSTFFELNIMRTFHHSIPKNMRKISDVNLLLGRYVVGKSIFRIKITTKLNSTISC